MASTVSSRHVSVPRSTMLIYGVGQAGAQIFRDTPAVLLPIFMITMLGVPAWIAGLVVLLPKLWVIFCDPLVGSLSDRLEGRHGRAPILALGAVLSGIGFFMLFAISGYGSPGIAAAVVCLLYLLASTGFSAFSVPYLAMASELSADAHERTKILVYRMIFTILGVVLGVGVAQPMVHHFGGGAFGWIVMGAVFALICFAAMMTTAIGLWRFRAPGVRGNQSSMGEQLQSAWRNRPFRWLTITHFIQSVAQACGYSVLGLIFLYPIGNVALMWPFVLCMSAAGLVSQPLWLATSRRFGKLSMFLLACVIWVAVTITWFLLGRAPEAVIRLPVIGMMSLEHGLVLARAVIIGISNSGFVLLAISLLTDTMHHGRQAGDAALEGSFAGVWSASEKLAFAVGPAMSGIILSYCGFQSSTGGAVAQPQTAVAGILLAYSLVPAAMFGASLIFLRQYLRAIETGADDAM